MHRTIESTYLVTGRFGSQPPSLGRVLQVSIKICVMVCFLKALMPREKQNLKSLYHTTQWFCRGRIRGFYVINFVRTNKQYLKKLCVNCAPTMYKCVKINSLKCEFKVDMTWTWCGFDVVLKIVSGKRTHL